MEAILGAAYLAGGIPSALAAGQALHLCFGGTADWASRVDAVKASTERIPHIAPLEQTLSYTFKNHLLLVEAVTHRSYTSNISTFSTPAYEVC